MITQQAGDSEEPPACLAYSTITNSVYYKIPCAIMALATFMKPAMLAPFT